MIQETPLSGLGQLGQPTEKAAAETILGLAIEIIERENKINVQHTSNIGKTKVEHFKKYNKTEMKTYGCRLDPKDKIKFERYFKKRGLSFSQAVRMVIKDFMERQGI